MAGQSSLNTTQNDSFAFEVDDTPNKQGRGKS